MNAIPAQLWLFLVKMRSSWLDLIHYACPKYEDCTKTDYKVHVVFYWFECSEITRWNACKNTPNENILWKLKTNFENPRKKFWKIFGNVKNCHKTLKKLFIIQIPERHFSERFRKIHGRLREFLADINWADMINFSLTWSVFRTVTYQDLSLNACTDFANFVPYYKTFVSIFYCTKSKLGQ